MRFIGEMVGLLVFVCMVWYVSNVYEHGTEATMDKIKHGSPAEVKCK